MKIHKLKFRKAILIVTLIFIFFDLCYPQWEEAEKYDDFPMRFFFKCCNKIFIYGGGIHIGFAMSADDGESWYEYTSIHNIETITCLKDIIVIGSCGGFTNDNPLLEDYLFISYDCGETWEDISYSSMHQSVHSLCSNETNIIAGTDNGIFLTDDNGKNWKRINGNLPIFNDPDEGKRICVWEVAYLGKDIIALLSDVNSLYISSDNGKNWEIVETPQAVNENNSIFDMVVFDNYIIIYLGDCSVYLSNNTRKDWINIGTELPKQVTSRGSMFETDNNIIVPINNLYLKLSKDYIRKNY